MPWPQGPETAARLGNTSKLYHGIIVAEVNANPIIQEAKCLIIHTAPLRQVHRTKKC